MSSDMVKANPAVQEAIGPTDMAPPSKGPPPTAYKVRVVIMKDAAQALLHSEDGALQMWCSMADIRKRMPQGNEGYFRAEIDPGTGYLELGERLPDLGWHS